jgi:hypothetical protein
LPLLDGTRKRLKKLDSRVLLDYQDLQKQENRKKAENLMGKILNQLQLPAQKKEKFLPLINYLTIYQEEQESREKEEQNFEILNEIIDTATSVHSAISGDTDKNHCRLNGIVNQNDKNGVLRCFRMILVSRYTVGGFYAMQSKEQYDTFTDPKSLTPVKLLDEETYWDVENNADKGCSIYPFKKMKYCNVLGRYDALSFTRTRPLCRCPLPYFDVGKNGEKNPYGFASLLTRREFGIRIDLNDGKKQCIDHLNRKSYGLVGAVSVALKRRSLRIPFLARLLASTHQDIGGILRENQLMGKE